jgi:hypothetical protein
MKVLIYLSLLVAVASVVVGIYSRLTVVPIPITLSGGVEAHSFLAFADTCFLFVIALTLLEMLKRKQ